MDWQTLLLIVAVFAGLEGANVIVSTATGGAIDIHKIAYDCSVERLVCPQSGYVNATRVQCNIFGCYEEPLPVEFTGYYNYDYAQKWDTDNGGAVLPIFGEMLGSEPTRHLCIMNFRLKSGEETADVLGEVSVNLTLGDQTHEYIFTAPEATGSDLITSQASFGVYRLGCYSKREVIGNNSIMYSGIIEDREECAAKSDAEVIHALEANAWFPEGRYDCKVLDFYFFPVLLVLITAVPMIFAYYSASGMWDMVSSMWR